MSMEDKAVFLKQLETALGERLTAAELNKALCAVSDALEGYELTAYGERSDEQDDLLGAFLTAMQIQGRSAKTVDRYVYIIRRMLKGVNASTRQVTVYHLRRYLAEERERGISDRTLEGYRQVFSSYFNWLQREDLISRNPVANLGAIKCQKKIKQTYSEVDIEKLKLHCRTLRDRAILCFLMSTGCRISEMTQLDRYSINFSTLEVKRFRMDARDAESVNMFSEYWKNAEGNDVFSAYNMIFRRYFGFENLPHHAPHGRRQGRFRLRS